MDGTREERLYHCQNWRGDVAPLIASTGLSLQAEGARFSSFGVADADFSTQSRAPSSFPPMTRAAPSRTMPQP